MTIRIRDAYMRFVAIERHSKLVLSIAMGKRDQATTDVFVEGLRHATRGEFQVTTDGFAPYRTAISNTFEDRCDFAMLIKVYRVASEGEARYSPAEVASVEEVPVQQEMGEPLGSRCSVFCILQFLPSPQVSAYHACDGGGNQWSRLERAGTLTGCVKWLPVFPRPPPAATHN